MFRRVWSGFPVADDGDAIVAFAGCDIKQFSGIRKSIRRDVASVSRFANPRHQPQRQSRQRRFVDRDILSLDRESASRIHRSTAAWSRPPRTKDATRINRSKSSTCKRSLQPFPNIKTASSESPLPQPNPPSQLTSSAAPAISRNASS